MDHKANLIKIAGIASVLPELIANQDLIKSDQNPLNIMIEAAQERNLSKMATVILYVAAGNYQSKTHCEHCTI